MQDRLPVSQRGGLQYKGCNAGGASLQGMMMCPDAGLGKETTIRQHKLPHAIAVLLHVSAAPAIKVPNELGAGSSRAPLSVYGGAALPSEAQALIALHQPSSLR